MIHIQIPIHKHKWKLQSRNSLFYRFNCNGCGQRQLVEKYNFWLGAK